MTERTYLFNTSQTRRLDIEISQKFEAEELAARIADGESVDWDKLTAVTPQSEFHTLQGLRDVEKIIRLARHRHASIANTRERDPLFRFGGLDVVERIGAGAQGEVYRAYDPMLDQQVALKLHSADSSALTNRFLDEARRLAQVRQPSVLSVYGAAVHEGRAGLWTELVHGTTLSDLAAARGSFNVDEIRSIAQDLCLALSAVHRHGLVHGDVKPENIMREYGGRLVLMDFGSASDFLGRQDSVISGTLNYMAPEVLRGEATTPAADLYSLGVLLFFLLSGRHPYSATSADELLDQRGRNARVYLKDLVPDLPAELLEGIEQALDPEPQNRPDSARAFAEMIEPARFSSPRLSFLTAISTTLLGALFLAVSVWHSEAALSWEIQTTLYRKTETGSIPAVSGTPVSLGDQFTLHVRSNRATYLYVLDDDGSSEPIVLFPLPQVAPGNPLAANREYELPGTDDEREFAWQISRRVLREEFIVVATTHPQPDIEQAIAKWQHAMAASDLGLHRALDLVAVPTEPIPTSESVRILLHHFATSSDASNLRYWHFVFPGTSQPESVSLH